MNYSHWAVTCNRLVFSSVDIYYSKMKPDGSNTFGKANTWKKDLGFVRPDHLFPPVKQVYSDLQGRQFQEPILHKPPWNYATFGRIFVKT